MPVTKGIHHLGLTVADVEASARFFTDILGWTEVKRRPDYPAIFVSDGELMLTLWQVQSRNVLPFDRKQNLGLHHLALQLADGETLQELHQRLLAAGIEIEFAPQPLGAGPVQHLMCYEPGGLRIEFCAQPH